MINLKAATAVSAKDEEHGLEVLISRLQAGAEPGTWEYEYDLIYPGGDLVLSLDAHSEDTADSTRPGNLQVLDMHASQIDKILSIRERIGVSLSEFEFLKAISRGLVNAFKFRYGVGEDRRYVVCADAELLRSKDADPPANSMRRGECGVILAELDVLAAPPSQESQP